MSNRIEKFANQMNFSVHTDKGVRIFTKREFLDFKPERGSQVFVGRVPADAYEDEIYIFFARIGPIVQIKLIFKLSGFTKGFCFVTFANAKLAKLAVAKLDEKDLRPNHSLHVEISWDNRFLRLMGAEGEKASTHQIKEVFKKIAKIEVEEIEAGCFRIEFPHHHLAFRALKIFKSKKVWGESARLQWENYQEKLKQVQANKRLECKPIGLAENEAVEELAIRLWNLRSLGQESSKHNVWTLENRLTFNQSPDSGLGSCRGSECTLSPTEEAAGSFSPEFEAINTCVLHRPKPGRNANINSITEYSITEWAQNYFPADNQVHDFQKSRLNTAYQYSQNSEETGGMFYLNHGKQRASSRMGNLLG